MFAMELLEVQINLSRVLGISSEIMPCAWRFSAHGQDGAADLSGEMVTGFHGGSLTYWATAIELASQLNDRPIVAAQACPRIQRLHRHLLPLSRRLSKMPRGPKGESASPPSPSALRPMQ
jgi:hypothetical protein